MTSFEKLSDDASVWVFAASRPWTTDQAAMIQKHIDGFLQDWSSHGSALRAAAKILNNSLLVVALDEGPDASGCSIDKLYRLVRDLGVATGTSLLEGGRIVYRINGDVRSVPRSQRAAVPPEAVIIDTTVNRLAAIRSGAWEKKS
jgi:hypothetical protein